uniref:Uncharacterized protein n=1 Tax=Anguilla anguilla TaxID=7936 RepID=A0A0E9RYQ7_ANGAN
MCGMRSVGVEWASLLHSVLQ